MNPHEALARLNPKIQHIQTHVDGLQGGLSGIDVAHALSGLKGGPYYLARYKWAQDDTAARDLEYYAWDYAIRVALDPPGGQRWIVGAEVLRRVSRCAVYEICRDGKCSTCGGREFEGKAIIYKERGLVEICPSCQGAGTQNMTDYDRAELTQMSLETFRKTWKFRYGIVYAGIYAWDQVWYRHVERRMR